jgi:4-hydroxy-tetrahydrodipicolinate reductase
MKIAVSGAGGRMGRRIAALGYEHPDVELSGALETPGSPFVGQDLGELAGVGHLGVPVKDRVEDLLVDCDALIDFTSPEASVANVIAAARASKAIVVGTTGFSQEQYTEIVTVGMSTKCLVAPNMSMGVNLLFALVGEVAQSLGSSYNVEIVESHHSMKKDAPSGTANKLAQIIAESLGRSMSQAGVYGRKGIVGERSENEIGVHAVRAGDIVGEHTIMFVTGGERIELTHRAHSRDAFAKGAILGALWLVSQPDGLYDMQDVLGLKSRDETGSF